jgi:CMP-N-acetylneuraminic acid synthetase
MSKQKVVAFVPLRPNSKRIPGKNQIPLGGHPLAWWVCDALLKSDEIDEVYAFCSSEYSIEGLPSDVKFLKRDVSLDSDSTRGIEIYRSFIDSVEAGVYVLAHATSPFIKVKTISDGVRSVVHGDYDSAFTVAPQQTFTWYQNKPLNYDLSNIVRTQELEVIYFETSALYIFERDVLARDGRRIGFNSRMIITNGAEA